MADDLDTVQLRRGEKVLSFELEDVQVCAYIYGE